MLTIPKTQARSTISNTTGSTVLRLYSIPPGELPPPPPKACFGREELIEKIVGLVEDLTPTALIGAGGIGKTSIALTVLHHDRIKQRFGVNRRFIRCDQFPAMPAHFLRRLSKVIGAGIEDPEDLTPLRPSLSSKEMVIILDNAESILDPQGTNAGEISAMVEELSQYNNICLCITSRITTVPRHCKRPVIPTLSMEAASDIFYGIYGDSGQSDIISNLLQRLDFHALSITLLATTASHNVWDYDRLAREWDTRRTQVLRTDYNESLAATIELSLASPTFQELGPDARALLEVIAFFPQGVDENNLGWLFPTISNGTNIFDKFCVLSLTHRSNGFATMLAPLRDYLRPKDPISSPLLCTAKESYFTRMSVTLEPGKPGYGEAQWIASEDVNVEHLLDIFTSIDTNSDGAWDACANFVDHLIHHKPRLTVLGSKIEGLADGHSSKLRCLFRLSQLFGVVGNQVECKRVLIHMLGLSRERGDDFWVAVALRDLSETNRQMFLCKEGIESAKEALEIFERLGNTARGAECLKYLAWLFYDDKQFDAAEEAASRVINLLSGKGERFLVCQSHRLLGEIYRFKDEREKAIYHFEAALGIASSFNLHEELFWVHYELARLFFDEDGFDGAHAHIERAKSHAVDNAYLLGRAMELQADFWYSQHRFEEAKSEVLRAVNAYEKVGAARDVEYCRVLLQKIQQELNSSNTLDF